MQRKLLSWATNEKKTTRLESSSGICTVAHAVFVFVTPKYRNRRATRMDVR